MVNYEKSVIYKIYCKDENINKIYVGSTTNFKKRFSRHKYRANKRKDIFLYKYISENQGFNNFKMEIIEEYKCDCKESLRKRERFWIEQLNAELNKQLPSRSKKEWTKNYMKTEKYKNYQKKYNKLKIKCHICNKEMLKKSLKRHIKNIH